MFHTVALLTPPFTTLTYARPGWLPGFSWTEGLRVLVPLGRGMTRLGVLLDAGREHSDLPPRVAVKPLLWPLESSPLLSGPHLDLVRQLALRQMVTPGQILASVLPTGLRATGLRLRSFDAAENTPRTWTVKDLIDLDEAGRTRLGEAFVRGEAAWLAPREDAASSEYCVLLKDPPWPVRPAAKRQLELLEWLLEQGSATRRELLRALGKEAAPALAATVRHGLVAIRRGEDDEASVLLAPAPRVAPAELCLSVPQETALAAFRAALDQGTAATHLLFGVTGSGKTAVYLELARDCLARGRSVFLLAPEVALALKLHRDAGLALPEAARYLFHGYQSPARREATFRELAQRESPCLVVGTRSALFLPAPHLGAVILDEEHDASFKQDEGLNYQAKEVAWFRTEQAKALLVLGSATPDLKTFHAAREDRLPMTELPDRVGGGRLPDIRLVDIRSAAPDCLLAPESLAALKTVVERGEQAVILLNRRGYAPLMVCLGCGKVARCPHCDIGLTYHKGRERLICHYCGYTRPFPSVCPHCQGMQYHPMGQGTERVEEYLSGVLPPGRGILRLDRDSTRRPGRMEAILEAFARQEAQVLVGTQMLSKGHHFPEVTLALIADGDLGLSLPDYRAAERTFQLLVQSAGRAGRGEKAGQVIIQTRDTAHYCWKYIQNGDYVGFYEQEIALRAKRRYPPFVRLALLRISHPLDFAEGAACLERLRTRVQALAREHGITALGPAPAPLPMIRDRRRFQCLLKASAWGPVRALYAALCQEKFPPELRLRLDLDPLNML